MDNSARSPAPVVGPEASSSRSTINPLAAGLDRGLDGARRGSAPTSAAAEGTRRGNGAARREGEGHRSLGQALKARSCIARREIARWTTRRSRPRISPCDAGRLRASAQMELLEHVPDRRAPCCLSRLAAGRPAVVSSRHSPKLKSYLLAGMALESVLKTSFPPHLPTKKKTKKKKKKNWDTHDYAQVREARSSRHAATPGSPCRDHRHELQQAQRAYSLGPTPTVTI